MSYPSKQVVKSIFSHLAAADFDSFISYAQSDATWSLQSTTPLGTRFNDSKTFVQKTFGRCSRLMDPAHPVSLLIDNVVGGVDDEWSAIEMHNVAIAKDGQAYDQKYAWLVRWSPEGDQSKIMEGRVYLDSALLERILVSCES